MQCIPSEATFAIANGPSDGTSKRSTKNLAVQIAVVVARFGANFKVFSNSLCFFLTTNRAETCVQATSACQTPT